MTDQATRLDLSQLRKAIQDEYAEVARNPDQGFHFHTGRPSAALLGYDDTWLQGIPEGTIVVWQVELDRVADWEEAGSKFFQHADFASWFEELSAHIEGSDSQFLQLQ